MAGDKPLCSTKMLSSPGTLWMVVCSNVIGEVAHVARIAIGLDRSAVGGDCSDSPCRNRCLYPIIPIIPT